MKDLKYLAALTIPLLAYITHYYKGSFSFITPVYAFIIIPIVALIFPIDNSNVTEIESKNRLKNRLFDWLLYLNLPIVYGLLIHALTFVKSHPLETYEFGGLIIFFGIVPYQLTRHSNHYSEPLKNIAS